MLGLLIYGLELFLTGLFLAFGFHVGTTYCEMIQESYNVAKIEIKANQGQEDFFDTYDPLATMFERVHKMFTFKWLHRMEDRVVAV